MASGRARQTPNVALVDLRESAGLSQHDLAEELNVLARRAFGRPVELTKKTVGRWERGEVSWPQPFHRRLLAQHFGVAVDDLGFVRPRPAGPARTGPVPAGGAARPADTGGPPVPGPRDASGHDRPTAREAYARHRRSLAVAAEALYPQYRLPGRGGTGSLADPSWLPAAPAPLQHVVPDLTGPSPVTESDGPATVSVGPLHAAGRGSRQPGHAVRDAPRRGPAGGASALRLLDVDWSRPDRQLSFGTMEFRDGLDVSESLAHETAHEILRRGSSGDPESDWPSWRRLAFRTLIGDPFDLGRRPVAAATGILTLRAAARPEIVLHTRDDLRVAGGADTVHQLPARVVRLDPPVVDPVAQDRTLWDTVRREYAGTMPGGHGYDGPGDTAGAEHPALARLDGALAGGGLSAYCLGVTLDALSLAADVLTVVVLAPEVYDELFAGGAADTAPHRVPFERTAVDELLGAERIAPGAAAALHLAWRHRDALLTRT